MFKKMFSCHFTKGKDFCDFLFASLKDKVLPKWCVLLKENLLFMNC